MKRRALDPAPDTGTTSCAVPCARRSPGSADPARPQRRITRFLDVLEVAVARQAVGLRRRHRRVDGARPLRRNSRSRGPATRTSRVRLGRARRRLRHNGHGRMVEPCRPRPV